MGNRIFVGIVVTLWAGTMSWLMVARILPPFFHGEPPTHGTLVHDPVCWEIQYGGRPVGHAVSQAVPSSTISKSSPIPSSNDLGTIETLAPNPSPSPSETSSENRAADVPR